MVVFSGNSWVGDAIDFYEISSELESHLFSLKKLKHPLDGIQGFCSNASLMMQVTKKIHLQCCRSSSLFDGSFWGSGIFPLDEKNVLYLESFVSESALKDIHELQDFLNRSTSDSNLFTMFVKYAELKSFDSFKAFKALTSPLPLEALV